MRLKTKHHKYKLSKLLTQLDRNAKKSSFRVGHFTTQEWAEFGLKDLDVLKKRNIITGQWKIVEDDIIPQHKSIEISKYKKLGSLKRYRIKEFVREWWTWVKLNYVAVLSIALTLIVLIVLLMVGIWTHAFGY